MKLDFIATERFSDRRYGIQEISYYVAPGGIEARKQHGDGQTCVLARYLIADELERQAIITEIRKLAASERKSARGHNDLSRLLRRWPSVHGFVEEAEVDSPARKVVVSGALNLPRHLAQAEWETLFR
jgi:hypothetical protein